ncbi:MAG TPA: hypothetical protein VFM38_15370 [Candidatus Limnocylindrales bacterium]|nr:hypothetical protein [Candidatus Limnocylindrales bacterium]
MAELIVPAEVEKWIDDGREDVERFAANGFGVRLHRKQIEGINALNSGEHALYLFVWANRTGKTTMFGMWYLHSMWYKLGLAPAEDVADYRSRWLPTDYRILHTAPLNELAGAGWRAWRDILEGTSPSQKDENGRQRPAPLAVAFAATKERDETGSDHLLLRCLNNGAVDFRSTEGGGSRIEGRSWRREGWDEWAAQENKDDIEEVVLPRLINRAADFEAPIGLAGTITEDTEHIAKGWIARGEDPENPDWWVSFASRDENPLTSARWSAVSERLLDPEDYARAVQGIPGGVRGRLLPDYLVDNTFRNDLPRFTPPERGDGFRGTGDSPWEYLHVWDLAIAAADNVGTVIRAPKGWRFGVTNPLIGVAMKVIPGSRTLTDEEIIHTIEETYLPYGGRIVLDTTDAHGKAIARTIRNHGYPVEEVEFNKQITPGVTRKDRMIRATRLLMAESLDRIEGKVDDYGVPLFDRSKPYGAIKLPPSWTKHRNQLSILRVDNDKQRKDAAVTILMACDVAYRKRRTLTAEKRVSKTFRVFGR